VRFQQLTALKPLISEVASDITVVDTSNYLPASGQPEQYEASPVEAIDAGQPETAWLQEQWGRPVIAPGTRSLPHASKQGEGAR